MKIYDMHIHSWGAKPNPEKLIKQMEKAGVYGGCIFSDCPHLGKNDGSFFSKGSLFQKRLDEVLEWTKGYEDVLFPILWIHPDEENIIENIHLAVDSGICGFKVICNDFYVYEEKMLKILREIAALEKPVFFHSGILWDGGVSSLYNRPLNWEALLEIKGLKFSMGHCSWPWIDECIALYGKFQNSLLSKNTAEMFFDITPGTPEIYRKELLTKLYTIGYDIGNNIMFGTDCGTENYSCEWADKWLKLDREILFDLGISKENYDKLCYKNLLRFLGKTKEEITRLLPEIDNSNSWSGASKDTAAIIEKWYNKLSFCKDYDEEFYESLNDIPISDAITIENYNLESKQGKRNLLSFLYMCEELSNRYAQKGISEEILVDTLNDIPRWCDTYSRLKGELYLGELARLSNHLKFTLFKLGRLQFNITVANHDIEKLGIKKGDDIIQVYVPSGKALDISECKASFKMAREFFNKYFPEINYKYFFCESWLLDDTLKQFLPQNSNIIQFANMFEKVSRREDNIILQYIFGWKIKSSQIKDCICSSSLAKKVKDYFVEGGKFYCTCGFIKK